MKSLAKMPSDKEASDGINEVTLLFFFSPKSGHGSVG